MFGSGLIKGLGITGKRMVGKTACDMYPYKKRVLPAKSRIFLTMRATAEGEPLCKACMTCQNGCPDHVISIEKDPGGERRAASFRIDSGRCTFCGLCAENCPYDALVFTQDFERATFDKGTLVYHLVEDGKATAVCVTVEAPPERERPARATGAEAAEGSPPPAEEAQPVASCETPRVAGDEGRALADAGEGGGRG